MNRSSHSTQGMWDLAKGSPSRGAVVQLPRAYSDRWPLGHPVGPPACPAHLTPVVTGAKPQARAEPQLDPPFVFAEPGRTGDTSVLSLLVLEQPSAARIDFLRREGPQETQTSLRRAWAEMVINFPGPNLRKLRGHSLAMALAGTCQQHPTEGPLWLSKPLRNQLSQKR